MLAKNESLPAGTGRPSDGTRRALSSVSIVPQMPSPVNELDPWTRAARLFGLAELAKAGGHYHEFTRLRRLALLAQAEGYQRRRARG